MNDEPLIAITHGSDYDKQDDRFLPTVHAIQVWMVVCPRCGSKAFSVKKPMDAMFCGPHGHEYMVGWA